jgi:enamine deaminase RidA (YjgF/YER057c/UK114 family)
MPTYSNPPTLLPPYGLYSQIARCDGPLYFVAGQLPVSEDGSVIGPGDLAAQLREVFRRIAAAAESVGLGMQDVVQFTTYLTDRALVPQFYAAREKLFEEIYQDGRYPPNTLLVVAGLVEPGVLVEVQAVLGAEVKAVQGA